jgi:hypothetical protein
MTKRHIHVVTRDSELAVVRDGSDGTGSALQAVAGGHDARHLH